MKMEMTDIEGNGRIKDGNERNIEWYEGGNDRNREK